MSHPTGNPDRRGLSKRGAPVKGQCGCHRGMVPISTPTCWIALDRRRDVVALESDGT